MSPADAVLADLRAEGDALDALVAPLDAAGWATPTPAAGWDVAHQVAHLAWTDEASRHAVDGGAGWQALLARAAEDPAGFVDAAADEGAHRPPEELLDGWRDGRRALAAALAAVPDGTRIAWFGPPMSAASMATARLMETWAHGRDVADALGVAVPVTDRVRHVCHLGVRTRGFAHVVHGLDVPEGDVRVELTGPSGDTWTWGAADAADRVTGPAEDFALLVTQRRHRDDLALTATGAGAQRWLGIAQAFAGAPGPGREPR
ncbi:TIGR03084 family metal-binding protein [Rhodococcus aerolatus]